jgi:hypothetical protein
LGMPHLTVVTMAKLAQNATCNMQSGISLLSGPPYL